MRPCPLLSVVVVCCLSPFGGPLFWDPFEQILTRFAARRRPPTGPTFGTRHRYQRVLAIKRCSKLCFVAICRHRTHNYGDFQTTGTVVESKKTIIHLWGFSNYRCCRGLQKMSSHTYGDFQTTGAVLMATNGDKHAVWDTFGGQIAAGSGLYGIKK